jgi:hypothetical protein
MQLEEFRSLVRRVVRASWARARPAWPFAVVVVAPPSAASVRVRADVAAELRQNDLEDLARRCMTKTPAGSVLVYACLDSGVGLHVVDMDPRRRP